MYGLAFSAAGWLIEISDWSEFVPNQGHSREIVNAVRLALYPPFDATRTDIVNGSAPFRYKYLLYNHEGADITQDFDNIDQWFGEAQKKIIFGDPDAVPPIPQVSRENSATQPRHLPPELNEGMGLNYRAPLRRLLVPALSAPSASYVVLIHQLVALPSLRSGYPSLASLCLSPLLRLGRILLAFLPTFGRPPAVGLGSSFSSLAVSFVLRFHSIDRELEPLLVSVHAGHTQEGDLQALAQAQAELAGLNRELKRIESNRDSNVEETQGRSSRCATPRSSTNS